MRPAAFSVPRPGRLLLPLAAALALAAPPPGVAQGRPTCESCHAELELLRQHTSTLEEARELMAPIRMVEASAHTGMTCTDCHRGFRGFPHAAEAQTTPCASCHESQEAEWLEGEHAVDGHASCASCHGVHDVRRGEEISTPDGARAMRQQCAECHFEPRIPEGDPHADSVSCSGCHRSHRTLGPGDERSAVHALAQGETCGECHEEVAAGWREDAHGSAVPRLARPGGAALGDPMGEPPTCTACHGAHGMLIPGADGFGATMVERCAHCHEPYAESFADSYHGQASTLGSEEVANCHDCHGAHGIFPNDDPRSAVGDERLLETCQTCHPAATAGFVLFQPHADHDDREEYPYVYWSYHLMTALLIGVFTVFGAHTLLWLARLAVEAMRGGSHADTLEGD